MGTGARLTVVSSTFEHNTAQFTGGGIGNSNGGDAWVSSSTFTGNTAGRLRGRGDR